MAPGIVPREVGTVFPTGEKIALKMQARNGLLVCILILSGSVNLLQEEHFGSKDSCWRIFVGTGKK